MGPEQIWTLRRGNLFPLPGIEHQSYSVQPVTVSTELSRFVFKHVISHRRFILNSLHVGINDLWLFPVCNMPYQSVAAGKQYAKASLALLSLFSLGYFEENIICNFIQA
jgi:hypothetical protein